MKSTSDVRAFFTKWYPRLVANAEISEEVARGFLEKRCVRLALRVCVCAVVFVRACGSLSISVCVFVCV